MARNQGRGNASKAPVLLLLAVLAVVLSSKFVDAATYKVGDASGWSFSAGSWPNGKRFKAGDVLTFNYNPKIHNVVKVTGAGYNTCKTPRGSQVFQTGRDSIKLARGKNYFICNFVGHCESGMKIAINAA